MAERDSSNGSAVERPPAGPAAEPSSDLADILRSVAHLRQIEWHEVDGRTAHEALDALELIARQLTAVRSQVLAKVDAERLWALDGQRTLQAWLRERTGSTRAAASREVRTSRALRDLLPLTAEALAAGRIGTEHVAALTRAAITTPRRRAQLSDGEMGEAFLVEQAQLLDAGRFAMVVQAWAIHADPEAADDSYREDQSKEEFTLAPTLNGFHLSGWLTKISGEIVDKALRAHMGRKAKDDDRSPSQRRAAALTSLAHQSLDDGKQAAHARVRPHVTVTVNWETLQALAAATGSPVPPTDSAGRPHTPGKAFGFYPESTYQAPGGSRDPDSRRSAPGDEGEAFQLSPEARAWMEQWQPGDDHVISGSVDPQAMVGVEPATSEDGTPIPPAMLARLACESALSRVVFGPDSAVLDVGREQRIFPAHMAKAIIARDRTCRFPGCDEPPGFGEIHHSLQWYRDNGPTDVEHGILLCWHHHDHVHANGVTIVRSEGRWFFYHRNGWLIEPTGNREHVITA